MKLKIKDIENKDIGSIELPQQFDEPVREDLIRSAVLAIMSHEMQPYGADPMAGKKHSTWVSRRRRKYRGSYGFGISRVPRKVLSRKGTRMNWVGALAPGTRGGRRAHPPKALKIVAERMNIKERRMAIRSALAASLKKDYALRRGHRIPETYPFIIDDSFESLKKTKEVRTALNTLGFDKELLRVKEKKVRAGKGKARGRKYKKKVGPLFVVSEDCDLVKSAKNLAGIEVVTVKNINAKLLAPGTEPGRAALFTKKSIEILKAEKLFI